MKLKDSVVFVTGANRGIGLSFAREALARGARKVYAAARDPASVTAPGVTPIALDVTDAASIAAAAAQCGDVTLLVNNAGIALFGGFLDEHAVDEARRQLEVNFFGPLLVTRAFAPILAANGGGGVINMLSIASWVTRPMLAVYAASKSAAWGLTNGLRNELRAQNTQVLGLHMGFVDTDMTKGIDAPKLSPAALATLTYDGLEAGLLEVLGDDRTTMAHQGLTAQPPVYLLPPA
jgi:NAD(P)-dependent dehydrogenase (short-subunit alcohol dehydrogenase family)